MKLAMSSIEWPPEQNDAIETALGDLGVNAIEVTPGSLSALPLDQIDDDAVMAFGKRWESQGIDIVAMQALLYHKPELRIFETADIRVETLKYLCRTIDVAALLGAHILVFGSPKNRRRGDLSLAEAHAIAVPFFREVGRYAECRGVVFCIEPNPTEYACDFICTLKEADAFVQEVGHAGFGLHVDAGALMITGESLAIPPISPIRHFHISQPFLTPVGAADAHMHEPIAAALRVMQYSNWLSIEMKHVEDPATPSGAIREAVAFARTAYGAV